jgi:hypothetical protein
MSKMIKEYYDLEKFDDENCIKYIRITMPLMSDRDNVLAVSSMNKEDGWFLNMRTTDHPKMPPIKKVIRMYNHICCFLK